MIIQILINFLILSSLIAAAGCSSLEESPASFDIKVDRLMSFTRMDLVYLRDYGFNGINGERKLPSGSRALCKENKCVIKIPAHERPVYSDGKESGRVFVEDSTITLTKAEIKNFLHVMDQAAHSKKTVTDDKSFFSCSAKICSLNFHFSGDVTMKYHEPESNIAKGLVGGAVSGLMR